MDFFGETFTMDGHTPVQSKVSAIVEMPAPTGKKQVQSFIGMVNYLSTFLVRLSELAEPIREVPFNWGPEHQSTFNQMKREIVRAPILTYYNPRKKYSYKEMQVPKDLAHACCKNKDLYILQVKH